MLNEIFALSFTNLPYKKKGIYHNMSKCKSIQLSEEYVNSAVRDHEGKETATNVYNSVKQMALFLGTDIELTKDEFILNLAQILTANSLSAADNSVKDFLIALSDAQKKQGANASPVSMVDTMLIPFAFEKWQKDKVVLDLDESVVSYVKENTTCHAIPVSFRYLPEVFWINPIKNEGDMPNDLDGTLAMIVVDSKKPSKKEIDSEDQETTVYVLGWSFISNESGSYIGHMTSFSVNQETELSNITLNPCKGMDATLLFNVASLLSLGFFKGEMTDISKQTYKKPNPNEKPKNRFNEIREYNIFIAGDGNVLQNIIYDVSAENPVLKI